MAGKNDSADENSGGNAQEKYVEYQLLQQQLEKMNKYNEELELKLAEFDETRKSLIELESVKGDREIFAPLAPGIFAKARISDFNKLLVNVGAETAVVAGIPHITGLISKQVEEVRGLRENINENIKKLAQRINILVEEIQAEQ